MLPTMSRPSRAPGAPVLLLGIVLGAVIVVTLIESLGGNPTVLLHFGVEYPDPRVNAYALEYLGDDLVYVNSIGHDGKWAFITAMDPLLLDPDSHARLMDHPAYRAQRVLLPVLAAPARALGGPPALAWSLQVVQAVGIALGVWASSRLAQTLGIARWWGLLCVVNPGVWLELAITGPGVLASALLLWGLAMTTDDRPVLAGWLFALSLLSRESMLVAVIAVGPLPEAPGPALEVVEGGEVRLRGAFGIDQPLQEGQPATRATLCRCGESKNKPWCDGRHRGRRAFR